MFEHLFLYLLSFVGIWIGAGMAIKAVEKVSHRLRLSSFAVSFLILGIFTSMSEFSVGVNAILNNDPEIYVGNLIGATIVLLMMIIPLLAITGKQIHISSELRGFKLPLALVVVSLPVILSFDGRVDKIDSLISIIAFVVASFFIEQKNGLMKKSSQLQQLKKPKVEIEILRAIIGVVIIFTASHFVVEQTMYFSRLLGLTPFLISLLLVAIGTNLPELSFMVKSIFMKSNQVAFGDYVGSAMINTFLFGVFTLIYRQPVFLTNSYVISLVFLIIGLIVFYFFARSKNTLSRREGWILFGLYMLFIFTEVITHIHV